MRHAVLAVVLLLAIPPALWKRRPMRFGTNPRLIITVLGLAAAMALGCGGGSDGPTGTPTASVQGYWVTTAVNNAGSAILTGCTGDFGPLSGLTLAAILGASSCTNAASQYTSQSGASYTHNSVSYTCDNGDFGTRAGGGTVNGNSIQGQMDAISVYNDSVGSAFVTGTKTGTTTLSISEYKITSSGTVVGSCYISPPLSTNMTINDTAGPFILGAGASAHILGGDDLIRYLRLGQAKP